MIFPSSWFAAFICGGLSRDTDLYSKKYQSAEPDHPDSGYRRGYPALSAFHAVNEIHSLLNISSPLHLRSIATDFSRINHPNSGEKKKKEKGGISFPSKIFETRNNSLPLIRKNQSQFKPEAKSFPGKFSYYLDSWSIWKTGIRRLSWINKGRINIGLD